MNSPDIPPAGCDPDAIKLFVGGIPKCYSEGQLLPFFSSVGKVVDLIVVRDSVTRQSKGSAFVWYETLAMAERAIQQYNMNQIIPDPTGKSSRPLVVRKAKMFAQATGPAASSSSSAVQQPVPQVQSPYASRESHSSPENVIVASQGGPERGAAPYATQRKSSLPLSALNEVYVPGNAELAHGYPRPPYSQLGPAGSMDSVPAGGTAVRPSNTMDAAASHMHAALASMDRAGSGMVTRGGTDLGPNHLLTVARGSSSGADSLARDLARQMQLGPASSLESRGSSQLGPRYGGMDVGAAQQLLQRGSVDIGGGRMGPRSSMDFGPNPMFPMGSIGSTSGADLARSYTRQMYGQMAGAMASVDSGGSSSQQLFARSSVDPLSSQLFTRSSIDPSSGQLFARGSVDRGGGMVGGPRGSMDIGSSHLMTIGSRGSASSEVDGDGSWAMYPVTDLEQRQNAVTISYAIQQHQLPVVNDHMHSIQAMSGAQISVASTAPGAFRMVVCGNSNQVEMAKCVLGIIFGDC